MEGDAGWKSYPGSGNPISTHALRMEGDMIYDAIEENLGLFLPTPSAWRAT